MKYELKRPIVINGNKDAEPITITELNLREEVCAGDHRDMPLGAVADPQSMTTAQLLKLTSRLCGQPEAALNKMGDRDLVEVAALVLGFMMAGRESGATPSP